MPTPALITSLSSSCRRYGLSPVSRFRMSVAPPHRRDDLIVDRLRRHRQLADVLRRALARELAEHDQIADSELPPSRFAPCSPAAHSPRGEQAGHRRLLGVGVDPDAAHEVVQRRPDLHRLLRDVDLGQLLELVVHRRQLALDDVGGDARRDVEEHAAVRRAAPGLDLGGDRARDLVAREQLGRPARGLVAGEPAVGLLDGVRGLRREPLGDVVEHEPLALVVLQDAAVAAHALGHEDAAHRQRPHHAGRMELRELDVHQLGAGVVRHRDAVARVLPRVRRDAPRLAAAAGREDHRLAPEDRRTGRSRASTRARRRSGRRP